MIGAFLTARWWVVVAATGVILAALYLLWAYQRVFHGEPDEENSTFAELRVKEALVILPFIAVIFFTGVYPKPMLERIEPAVNALMGMSRSEQISSNRSRPPLLSMMRFTRMGRRTDGCSGHLYWAFS